MARLSFGLAALIVAASAQQNYLVGDLAFGHDGYDDHEFSTTHHGVYAGHLTPAIPIETR